MESKIYQELIERVRVLMQQSYKQDSALPVTEDALAQVVRRCREELKAEPPALDTLEPSARVKGRSPTWL